MWKNTWPVLCAVLAALLFWNRPPLLEGQVQPKVDYKIGVVDFSRAAKHYKKYKRIKKRLEFQEQKMKKELEDIKDDIEMLKKELKMLNPNSAIYKRKKKELVKKQAELVYLYKQYQKEYREKVVKYTREIVEDLEEAIQAYGALKGYHVIFRRYLPIDKEKEMEVLANFNTVMYHSKAIDITDEIIRKVNELYDLKRKKKDKKSASKEGEKTK